MTPSLKELPEYLKMNAADIHFFGLGFIQVKLNDSIRYHFYHPELNPIVGLEELHNHRYDFTSYLLKGALSQEVFVINEAEEEKEWTVEDVLCEENSKLNPNKSFCEVEKVLAFTTLKNGNYTMFRHCFHRVLPVTTPTISRLERGPVVDKFAKVIKPIGFGSACPFSSKMSKEQTWEYICEICKT